MSSHSCILCWIYTPSSALKETTSGWGSAFKSVQTWMPKTAFTRFLSWSNILLSSRWDSAALHPIPATTTNHVLMGVWSWSFPLPTVVLKLVQFVDLSESFLSFLPVKRLNLIPWWASTFPSPCMTRTGHGKALFKAMRQQNNISTTFDTRGTLLSGLNMATYSRCPWDTWIHQH